MLERMHMDGQTDDCVGGGSKRAAIEEAGRGLPLRFQSKSDFQPCQPPNSSSTLRGMNIVCAADDAYAMPLAVTLKSACRQLLDGERLRVFLLSGGLSDQNWQRLLVTLKLEPIELIVLEPEEKLFADLTISHHISHTAYYRLMAAELLPEDVGKAIYLDSDLLIRENLSGLWDRPIDDFFCLASPDIACPYVDAKIACKNYRQAIPYMAARRPVRNYRSLGMDGGDEYFNSGVMVLNLERWRRENVAERLLKILRDHKKYVWCWDQYALNVLFHGNWGRIAPRWNQGAHAFEYPSVAHVPIDGPEWLEMKSNPAIYHFTTEFKPWQFQSRHPRGHIFYEGLSDTAWRGWRPEEAVRHPIPSWFSRESEEWFKAATRWLRWAAATWL